VTKLDTYLQLTDLVLVFSVASDEWRSLVDLALDPARHSLLVAEEITVGLGTLLIEGVCCVSSIVLILTFAKEADLFDPVECLLLDLS